MSKWFKLQAAHEVRMWIGTIAAGVTAAAAIDSAHPELKYKIADGVKKPFKAAKEKFEKKD